MDGREIGTLADLPPLRDGLLFVGLHPDRESVTAGHYHQDAPGRRFWRYLIDAEILPPGTPTESADDVLVERGHGLTTLLKMAPSGPASVRELAAGVGPLWQKVAIWRPAAVVFIDRHGAQAAAGRVPLEPWGRLPGVALAGRPCLLLPGPEIPAAEVGAAVAFFRDLAGLIEALLPAGNRFPAGPATELAD
jgi:hypothetical protein